MKNDEIADLWVNRHLQFCKYTDTKMITVSLFDSQLFRKAVLLFFFFYRGTLTLRSIQNEKGSTKTTITQVSGGQGSSWMCKKATVQVSVDQQVSPMRFYHNSVMNQIYLPTHSLAISLTVVILLRLNSLSTVQYLPASLHTIISFFFLPSILLSFLPSLSPSILRSFLPSFQPTCPPDLPPPYLRSHRDEIIP